MVPGAGGSDEGAHCALRSCWEPQDSDAGTAGSQHPRTWGCVQSQEPGRTRCLPSTAFREVFQQKLKLYSKNKSQLQPGLLLGAVSQLRQHPGGRSRNLGTSSPVPGPPCLLQAPRGHTGPPLLLLPGPVRARPGHPGRFWALPGSQHSKR